MRVENIYWLYVFYYKQLNNLSRKEIYLSLGIEKSTYSHLENYESELNQVYFDYFVDSLKINFNNDINSYYEARKIFFNIIDSSLQKKDINNLVLEFLSEDNLNSLAAPYHLAARIINYMLTMEIDEDFPVYASLFLNHRLTDSYTYRYVKIAIAAIYFYKHQYQEVLSLLSNTDEVDDTPIDIKNTKLHEGIKAHGYYVLSNVHIYLDSLKTYELLSQAKQLYINNGYLARSIDSMIGQCFTLSNLGQYEKALQLLDNCDSISTGYIKEKNWHSITTRRIELLLVTGKYDLALELINSLSNEQLATFSQLLIGLVYYFNNNDVYNRYLIDFVTGTIQHKMYVEVIDCVLKDEYSNALEKLNQLHKGTYTIGNEGLYSLVLQFVIKEMSKQIPDIKVLGNMHLIAR